MNKKRLAIDLDDTLTDNMTRWLEAYNNETNHGLALEDIKGWHLSNYVVPEWKDKAGSIFLRPNWFIENTPKIGAVEKVKELSESNEIFILTAYYPTCCADKAKFIETHFPFIPQRNIIFCNHKNLVHTDYLIDDGPHNLVDFSGVPICFDRPWNRDLKKNSHGQIIRRIYGWEGFVL